MYTRICVAITCIGTLLFCGCEGTNISVQFGGANAVEGSGQSASEQRELASFNEVRLDVSADVRIKSGEKISCEVRGDDNIIPLIATEVSGDRLRIFAKESFSTKQKLAIHLEEHELCPLYE